MTADDSLPRLIERPHGSRLVTRIEAANLLGYSVTSMATVMSRAPERWPRPAGMLRQGRVWLLLWDADELLAAAPPATATRRSGAVATISDTDGLLTCLECGRRMRSLGRHLSAKHQMSAVEYRERHHLPATGALAADGTRQALSEHQRAALATDPDALNHLQTWQTPEHLAVMRDAAIDSHRTTMTYELVRDHRRPGQRRAVQVMNESRRSRLDEIARGTGFTSIEAAIEETAELPARQAGLRIGIGASTVRRWRKRRHDQH